MKMTVVTLLVGLLSLAAHAQNEDKFGGLNISREEFVQALEKQQDPVQFTYVKNIEWQGKHYQMYRTQYDDSVLVGQSQVQGQINNLETKEQERERTDKRGVYLPWMAKARGALSREGMFQVGIGIGRVNFSRERILKDRAEAQVGVDPSYVLNDLRTDDAATTYNISRKVDTEYQTLNLFVAYRPHFYRHVRLSAGFDISESGDSTYMVDGIAEKAPGGVGTRPEPGGYVLAIEHDLIAIPAKDGYIALSAGLLSSRQAFTYEFSKLNPAYRPGVFNDEVRTSSSIFVKRDIKDTGAIGSVRWFANDSFDLSVSLNYYLGRQGTSRVTLQLSTSLGKKNDLKLKKD